MFMPEQDPIPWWKRLWYRILRYLGFRRFNFSRKIVIPRFSKPTKFPDIREMLCSNSLKDPIADKDFTFTMKIGDGNEKASH